VTRLAEDLVSPNGFGFAAKPLGQIGDMDAWDWALLVYIANKLSEGTTKKEE
jgi:hypothetical protein